MRAPPRIATVAIVATDHPGVRQLVGRSFDSLGAADRALGAAFTAAPPAAVARVDFLVTWRDGAAHVGTIDVTAARLADAPGALLYAHLRRYDEIVDAPGYVEVARALGHDLAARRAWAAELRARLDAEFPRNARPGRPRAEVAARPAADAPRVREVAITFSENAAVAVAAHPSIWAADAALAAAFQREPPPPGRAYAKTFFRIDWTDGAHHEGRVDVSREALARAASRGGLLRAHLDEYARWLASDDYLRMFAGHRPGDEIAHAQAWGVDLGRRLAVDLAAHVDPRAPRNRAVRPRRGAR